MTRKPTATAGQLQRRVTFSARSEVDDGYGNTTGSWTDQFTVWARVKPLKGGDEAVQASRLQGRQPVVITVRVTPKTSLITPEWKATDADSGVEYALTAPPANMDEDNQFFDILATTGEAT